MLQKLRAYFLVACSLLAVQGVRAQGNATIVGIINDSSGAAVPKAEVTLTNEGTGLREIAVADSAGRYNFPRLPVGNYRIDVVLAGFKKISQTGINLTAEQSLTVNFDLQVGQVNETVEVSALVTGLETVTSTVRTVVTNQLIEDLPLNGRNALSLQTLIPGAVNQAGARVSLSQEDGVSVNGARGNDNWRLATLTPRPARMVVRSDVRGVAQVYVGGLFLCSGLGSRVVRFQPLQDECFIALLRAMKRLLAGNLKLS